MVVAVQRTQSHLSAPQQEATDARCEAAHEARTPLRGRALATGTSKREITVTLFPRPDPPAIEDALHVAGSEEATDLRLRERWNECGRGCRSRSRDWQ